ncbi:MAG TPA: hypothetical protein VJ803_05720 [Gemmatimonadaceae bacterium]|nr:hypothetical protein [Gemmatimonadaceae bacterium]
MSGRFRVAGAFPLDSVGLFAVHGEIVDGVAHVGQFARSPSGFEGRVHGVEFVRLADGREDLALTFLPSTPEQSAAWQGLALPGEEIELAERRP